MFENLQIEDKDHRSMMGEWEHQRSSVEMTPEDARLVARATENTEETSIESKMAEAAMGMAPQQGKWLGAPGTIFVQGTNPFDDRINGTDMVKEIVTKVDGIPFILRWSEDITRRHPEPNSRSLRGREEVHKKVARMKKNIEMHQDGYGRDAGRVKYFKSLAQELTPGVNPYEQVIRSMPGVVISLPDGTIEELLELNAQAVKGDNDKREALSNHPAKKEYLAQVLYGLRAQVALLRNKHKRFGTEEFKEALERAEAVTAYVKFLLNDDEYAMQNEWLREFYEVEFGEYMKEEETP